MAFVESFYSERPLRRAASCQIVMYVRPPLTGRVTPPIGSGRRTFNLRAEWEVATTSPAALNDG